MGCPGRPLSLAPPEAHKNTYCTVAGFMGGGTFFKGGGTRARWKEIVANFVVWVGNCDVTSIEIWCHTYVPCEGLNYTISDKTTPPWQRIGEPPEIQIAVTEATQVISVIRANHTICSDWLNKTVRRLRHWNFHLLSFWLSLSLPCDVMLCNNKREILMITSHRAVITP